MIKFIAIMGPSASGKTTLKEQLKLNRLITYTTRKPRAGEVDGVDYFFVDTLAFARLKNENKLLESTLYGGASYGLGEEGLRRAGEDQNLYAVVLDASGVEALISHYPKETLVVGLFADKAILKERLIERGESSLKERLASYEVEIKQTLDLSDLLINTSKFKTSEVLEIVKNTLDVLKKGGK